MTIELAGRIIREGRCKHVDELDCDSTCPTRNLASLCIPALLIVAQSYIDGYGAGMNAGKEASEGKSPE